MWAFYSFHRFSIKILCKYYFFFNKTKGMVLCLIHRGAGSWSTEGLWVPIILDSELGITETGFFIFYYNIALYWILCFQRKVLSMLTTSSLSALTLWQLSLWKQGIQLWQFLSKVFVTLSWLDSGANRSASEFHRWYPKLSQSTSCPKWRRIS